MRSRTPVYESLSDLATMIREASLRPLLGVESFCVTTRGGARFSRNPAGIPSECLYPAIVRMRRDKSGVPFGCFGDRTGE